MHLHKYEKIWLAFGIASLVLFLSIIGVNAFVFHQHPSGGMETVDPKKVEQTPPFDNPGIKKIDEDTYEVVIVAMTFGYKPAEIKVPTGKKIIFKVTSKDITHSFSIVNTNVNMMIVPGQISTKEYTFTEPGNYLIICNEYCGTGHQFMKTAVEVVDND